MGTKRERVIVGVSQSAGDARRTVEDLRNANFSDRQIGVLTYDKEEAPHLKSFRFAPPPTRLLLKHCSPLFACEAQGSEYLLTA